MSMGMSSKRFWRKRIGSGARPSCLFLARLQSQQPVRELLAGLTIRPRIGSRLGSFSSWRRAMTVNVKTVANRRKLRYNTLQDLLEDAEQLSTKQVRTLGNKSYSQILQHLAFAMNGSVDGSVLVFPWPVRTVARLLRKRILNGG